MDGYKKFFKKRATRRFILSLLRFLPDRTMLKIQYKIKTGRKLNLKNPIRFTEKLQYYKLFYRNKILRQCVDKLAVREYVKSKGLENILVKLYATYDSIDEINFNNLPKSFVVKTTNGGGGNNVVLCKDKYNFDIKAFADTIKLQKYKPRTEGREWAYYNIAPRIIIEELLLNKDNEQAGVNDYKFFCYDGKPTYIVVDVDRYIGHKRNFYDANWNNLNVTSDCPPIDREIQRPDNLDDMIRIASILSEGFPFVRVDLYNVSGKIYFGELTFYPWSGYVVFKPDEMDKVFGDPFDLTRFKTRDKL